MNDLIKKGIGQKALERVLRKLGQKKVQSGKYTMVVDPMNSSRLLSPMMSALNGSALQQKNSFLLNKLNEKIASEPADFDGRTSFGESLRRPLFRQ